jgi:hypothetical protein
MKFTEITIIVKDSDLPTEGKYTKGFLSKLYSADKRVEIKSNLIGGNPAHLLYTIKK